MKNFLKKVSTHIYWVLFNFTKKHMLKIHVFIFIYIQQRYFTKGDEKSVLRGKDISISNNQSVLFFSLHKCATTYVGGVLQKLLHSEELVYLDYDAYYSKAGYTPKVEMAKPSIANKIFHPAGYFYGIFRNYRKVPDINKYRLILFLRDPRDILTSMYFTLAYNHPLDSIDLINERKRLLKTDINNYVKEAAPDFKEKLTLYIAEYLSLDNTLFIRYEDMIEDFETWLFKICDYINIDKNTPLINELLETEHFKVAKESASNFKRQVTPGDHKRKLTPETITWLNNEFKDILEALGYES